ncbi:hydrolase 1, exosortase A system-associated [Erythrobacter alti]|uniref:hydrolase 1, exosortase A system-associated n=1 Tax=Erythrobacter alti TaxID=1896145 RepID=UPI0030F433DB
MTRRHITFGCGEEKLVGTLDGADGPVGLLIVSGGNEIRSGAFSGQAKLAAKIADAGYRVFRYDRPGIGDSSGDNRGFRDERGHVASAQDAFKAQSPSLSRIVAFGNCDAASALMLQGGAGCEGLVLANPWTFDEDNGDALPPEAIRARYAKKLADPREWFRLLRGKVSIRKLVGGLTRAATSSPSTTSLAADMRNGLADYGGDIRFLIAGRDRTGLAFCSAWGKDDRVSVRDGADHAFSAPEDFEWLRAQLLSALDEQARQLNMG